MAEMVESAARLPGWTLLKNPVTKSVRYVAPDGSNIGAYGYKTAFKYYEKTGVVPQSPLGTRHLFSKDKSNESRLQVEVPVSNSDDTLVLELPETKPTSSSRTKSGLFNAREISDGLATILVIVTSMIAVSTSLPEAQMTEQEVKAISIPLANIIERSKMNKTIGSLVVDKSDFLTLGYALFVYVDRVTSAAKEKRYANNQPFRNTQQAEAARPTAGVAGLNGHGPVPVPLRPTPTGLRGYTGNGQ